MFGTPICPKCSKAVYAAEQAMGPGRKLYHKPCLACMQCNKRLDSYTLLEHNEQPYCKACHLKSFGTPNLRHANLPVTSPTGSPNGKKRSTSPSSMPLKPVTTGTPGFLGPILVAASTSTPGNGSVYPKLRPNRSLTSPTSPTFARTWVNPLSPSSTGTAEPDVYGSASVNLYENENGVNTTIVEGEEHAESDSPEDSEAMQVDDAEPKVEDDKPVDTSELGLPLRTGTATSATNSNVTTNTGRPGIGTIPRTVPLRHMNSRSMDVTSSSSIGFNAIFANTTGTGSSSSTSASSSNSPTSFTFTQPRSPTSPVLSSFATGTRYGIALTGGVPSHSTGMGVGMNYTGMGGMIPSPTGGSPRKWGAGTPTCGRCGKSVYFAEQIKAAGKMYHKTCLRCVDCGTSLDSHKLRDHDGQPYCVRCYQKAYGPQGNGYALLGKAGG